MKDMNVAQLSLHLECIGSSSSFIGWRQQPSAWQTGALGSHPYSLSCPDCCHPLVVLYWGASWYPAPLPSLLLVSASPCSIPHRFISFKKSFLMVSHDCPVAFVHQVKFINASQLPLNGEPLENIDRMG